MNVKKPLLTLILVFSSFMLAFSQVSVEGVNINELDIKYCELVGFNKSLFGVNIVVTVDYGQKYKFMQSQLIKGPDGKAVEFNSMVDALNFMEENGWEYVNNYAVSSGNGAVYNFLLKRKEEEFGA